jgi:predicted TIM-barrel fold metal-dependent hydrolase
VPNEYIAEFVTRDPQRRIGIAGVDPMSPAALDDIDAASALGLAGVTLHPAAQGFHPVHSAAMRIYERCDELRIPVFIGHGPALTTSAMLEFARPSALDEVARSFPRLRVIVAGLGYPWIDETLALLGKHDFVYADISGVTPRPWQLFNALLSASATGVMDRLLFGSGFPFSTPAAAIESLYSINSFGHGTQLPTVQRALIRGIVERNSLELLGLPGEEGAPRRTTSRLDTDAAKGDRAPAAPAAKFLPEP